ncbi:Transmembrane GTPase fzo1 [Fusarium austroafricanum]|uniref:Transmembrane GTPase fzo1 n=1 Tax=Fusarium austroafricanum TaxID=2364996 RepID=A0A8H4JZE1_9HYPO|nr:Transmembrane GTPase fzo1 [Fusarium austroafricanum]
MNPNRSNNERKGKAPMKNEHDEPLAEQTRNPQTFSQPHYMTVGNGPTSAHAARLQAMLDSGYGSSTAGDEAADMAMLPDLPLLPRDSSGIDAHSQAQGTSIEQLCYDRHRAVLGRSVDRVIQLLTILQEINVGWSIYYPTTDGAQGGPKAPNLRPNLMRAQSAALPETTTMHRDSSRMIRRCDTSYQDDLNAESSKMAEERGGIAPRLLASQLSPQLAVLNIDLKLGHLRQADLVHTLERSSVASLLDEKIRSAVSHLQSLRARIEDLSSKILITGDVNAGKSTFCNALLRRKVLPEDQQPCTAIFCEVLDAMENDNVEEVHAVHLDTTYNRRDEQTYDIYAFEHLADIVSDNTKYHQCKVYVRDTRATNQSLLNNGTVQITLIDAPGLNSHTAKTTAVFSRQEEIDVVIFVVSATNHFTISAQEFITAAAAEKAYLFMVVNGFDAIRNKERCRKAILTQLVGLSPRTLKESSELVHFVSSQAVPLEDSQSGGSGDDSTPDGDGDDPNDDPKGKGKDVESIRDFDKLEESLRRFILEKRARSKLAPAKHYLLNILNDINILAAENCEIARLELDKGIRSLQELEPQLEKMKEAVLEVDNKTEDIIETMQGEVYNSTRTILTEVITHAGDRIHHLDAPYPGLFSVMSYSEDIKDAILTDISASVTKCEEHARASAVKGVNMIKQLGLLHLGDEYQNLTFHPAAMFRRKRDELAKQIHISTEFSDFVEWPLLFEGENFTNVDTALKVATAVGGGWIGIQTWMDQAVMAARLVGNINLRRAVLPGIVCTGLLAVAYIIWRIPTVHPRRISAKIAAKLAEIDYVHANATRISGSVRKVLRIPSNNIRVDLDRAVKDVGERRDESLRVKAESNVALTCFRNLVQDSAKQKTSIEGLDLEAYLQT